MKCLYDLNEAFRIEKTKKKYNILLIILGLIILTTIVLITYFLANNIIMIVDIILSFSYISFLFTYFAFIKKELNIKYHFLAKIQQFKHETLKVNEIVYDENIQTINGIESYELKLDEKRIVYIENIFFQELEKIEFKTITLDIVDKFVVGYEVYYD